MSCLKSPPDVFCGIPWQKLMILGCAFFRNPCWHAFQDQPKCCLTKKTHLEKNTVLLTFVPEYGRSQTHSRVIVYNSWDPSGKPSWLVFNMNFLGLQYEFPGKKTRWCHPDLLSTWISKVCNMNFKEKKERWSHPDLLSTWMSKVCNMNFQETPKHLRRS